MNPSLKHIRLYPFAVNYTSFHSKILPSSTKWPISWSGERRLVSAATGAWSECGAVLSGGIVVSLHPATCTPTPATIVLGLLLGPTAWSCHLRLSSRKYCSVQQTRGCYESSAAVVLALVILHYCVQQYNMDYIAEMQTPGLSQTNIYKSSKIYVDCRLCVWTIILVCLGLSHPIFSECFLEVQSCFTAHFLEVPDVLFISLQHENLLGAKLLELGPGRAGRIRKYKCDSRDIFRRSGKKGRNCDWHFRSG